MAAEVKGRKRENATGAPVRRIEGIMARGRRGLKDKGQAHTPSAHRSRFHLVFAWLRTK